MFCISHKVGTSDLTGKGMLRYSAVVDYMQDCSGFQLLTLDTLQKYFKDNNIGMYLVSRQIDIHRLPCYCEDITIKTVVYECKSMYGYRNTMIYDDKNELCVSSYSVGAFINLNTARPVKVPDEVVGSIAINEKFDMEYLPRKVEIPDVKGIRGDEILIGKYHIDVFAHVNNAKYIDLAEEILPDDFEVKRIRMDFRTPAKIGEKITPTLYLIDSKAVVELKCGEISCARVEFS